LVPVTLPLMAEYQRPMGNCFTLAKGAIHAQKWMREAPQDLCRHLSWAPLWRSAIRVMYLEGFETGAARSCQSFTAEVFRAHARVAAPALRT